MLQLLQAFKLLPDFFVLLFHALYILILHLRLSFIFVSCGRLLLDILRLWPSLNGIFVGGVGRGSMLTILVGVLADGVHAYLLLEDTSETESEPSILIRATRQPVVVLLLVELLLIDVLSHIELDFACLLHTLLAGEDDWELGLSEK